MSGASLTHDRLRLAIVSTPRSGNTWVREALGRIYDVKHLARHIMRDADWRELPQECILQIHWRREPEFVQRLQENGFRVLVVARHPFDVLLSILHVVIYDVDSERWLDGRHGDERCLWGAMPRSRPFIDYAKGPRAGELLAVSCDWWHDPAAIRVRYEEMVANPEAQWERLVSLLGPPRGQSFAEVLAETSLERQRRYSINNHFWKGQPGLWRELLPPAEAEEIFGSLQWCFDALGYVCDPDPNLDACRADANWVQFAGEELGRTLRNNSAAVRNVLDHMNAHCEHVNAQAAADRRDRDHFRDEFHRLETHLAQFEGLTGLSLRVARVVQKLQDLTSYLRRSVRRSA
jgi:Sulfotransferase domain